MSTQINTISAIDQMGNGLILRMDHRPARFGHSLVAVRAGVEHSLLTSVEGTDQQDWPPSPPLQDFSIEEQSGADQVSRQVLLAVGMAGTSHWSASVIADPATRSIEFDVACRAKTTPSFLGSTYQFVGPAVYESEDHFRFENFRVHMKSLTQTGQATMANDRIAFLAKCPQIQRDTTVRWRYQIGLLD
jgi:hypothetical protein